jgi:hypothetical protein
VEEKEKEERDGIESSCSAAVTMLVPSMIQGFVELWVRIGEIVWKNTYNIDNYSKIKIIKIMMMIIICFFFKEGDC